MEAKNLVLGRQATKLEIEAIEKAIELLASVELELIGTRPKDR